MEKMQPDRQLLRQTSTTPILPVDRSRSSANVIAGAMDDNVHMQNSLQFLHAMQQAQKDCDFMVYPRVRHGIGDLQQQVHLFTRFQKFLKENL